MVHRRELDGSEIVLGNHGALFGNAMTWWDHDTGSVWSQPLGEAILGPLAGARLELLSSTLTTWDDWRRQHPSTRALDAPTALSGVDLSVMSIVVDLGTESMAFLVPDVRAIGVANETVAGVPIAVLASPEDETWTVFSRRLDDRVVELALVDGELREVGGTATFDPTLGTSANGGQGLDRLPAFTSFPRDYATFFPDGLIWTADGITPVAS